MYIYIYIIYIYIYIYIYIRLNSSGPPDQAVSLALDQFTASDELVMTSTFVEKIMFCA